MSTILGLLSTESVSSNRFQNYRRAVFLAYPEGAAPLTGLLSLMGEEDTNDPVYRWFEKRHVERSTTTASANSDGPFTATGGDVDKGTTGAGWTASADLVVRVKVASGGTDKFRVNDQVVVKDVPNAAGSTRDMIGIVTSIVSGVTTKMEIRLTETAASNPLNTTAANDLTVLAIGSAYYEGVTQDAYAAYNTPTELYNYTQILRTSWKMTGSAVHTAVKYDKTGAYQDKAKENSMDHMIGMERSFLFGRRYSYVDTSTGLPVRTTGGIRWFLEQWEAGTSYGVTASTANTDENKRIININGSITKSNFEDYLRRVFQRTNKKDRSKLGFCGNKALAVLNTMYEGRSVLNMSIPSEKTFGMNVVEHITPYGRIYWKTHPLFNEDTSLNNDIMIVDPPFMKYRYLQGRDTALLKNRQPNNADYREDEYLSECGLELQFPEAFMWMRGVNSYSPA